MEKVYELRKRVIPSTRWRHVGYFRTHRDAVNEKHLPLGSQNMLDWNITEHDAFFDPDTPDRAVLVNPQEVPLGKTAFFVD